MHTPEARSHLRTFAITGAGLFMFALDRQVVATALPAIRRELSTSLQALEWTVNAYTLTFAVLLLTAAALGDRFGRRRVFSIGVAIFTAGSAACALAPSATTLIAARALQGIGGAIITPLSLTILATATPPARRGAVLGAWGAIAGGAASLGPVVGGALTTAISWHWIFWINVPVGIALIPLACTNLEESHGPRRPLDLVGIALSGAALLACAWALIDTARSGWGSARVLAPLLLGAAAAARLRRLGAARARADAADALLQLTCVLGRGGRLAAVVLLVPRRSVPGRAAPPDRTVRHAGPGWVRAARADLRRRRDRAGGRRAVRSPRAAPR